MPWRLPPLPKLWFSARWHTALIRSALYAVFEQQHPFVLETSCLHLSFIRLSSSELAGGVKTELLLISHQVDACSITWWEACFLVPRANKTYSAWTIQHPTTLWMRYCFAGLLEDFPHSRIQSAVLFLPPPTARKHHFSELIHPGNQWPIILSGIILHSLVEVIVFSHRT
jgi:hypothetical protein